MMALARRLVVQARARALSQEEAACVARQAARDEWGPDVPSSVVRNDPPGGPEILFVARHALVATGATAEWNVSVDTSSPAVLEVNGRTIDSTGVAALLSRMRAVRASPSLSGAEALAVAVRVPSIVARISAKCSLLSADFGTANRRFISLEDTCKEHPRELQVVGAVNVRTGAVTDPRTQKALDTPESVHLARELLHRAEARRAEVMAEIDRACR
jgi:hypothetical protein